MTLNSTMRAILAFLVLAVLHYTLRPLLGWRAPIDFLLLAVITSAVRGGPATGAVVGFVVGLLGDSLNAASFGAGALGMTFVGYAAAWLKAVFFAESMPLNALFFFLGKWAFDIIYFTAERRLSGVELVQQLVLWSPLSAAATAIAGVIVLLVCRPLFEQSSS